MATVKPGFEDFVALVSEDCAEYVRQLHRMFMDAGCKIDLKEAKNGYVVSYLLNKKTVVNYVFRKKGLIIRIYANHLPAYMGLLESFPDSMTRGVKAAPDCKRLLQPGACNARCAMGYDFFIGGEHQQKCRYGAFMFLINEETKPFIRDFVRCELQAAGLSGCETRLG